MSETASGVLALHSRNEGVLRDPARSLRPSRADVRVPADLIRRYGLITGAEISGPAAENRYGRELRAVDTICGLAPEAFASRRPFKQLTAVDPHERFDLSASGEIAPRIVDLIAPIGKGTRGLIVAPPKAGKTMLLMAMAKALRLAEPTLRIIALLIDERPEEVTHFRRSVDAVVFASSKDQGPNDHVDLAELTLAYARTLLECGQDVIILVDSLTRMARAYNVIGSGTGRTMTGGLEAGVMEVPRQFFGLARKVEGGGSLTLVATILVETGSRMDDLIFQEFKGTGNSEVMLSRELAEARIFPAIDIPASGTRKENLLYSPEELRRVSALRRALGGRKAAPAMRSLLKAMAPFPTNAEFLDSFPIA